jgi:hypothetical protein
MTMLMRSLTLLYIGALSTAIGVRGFGEADTGVVTCVAVANCQHSFVDGKRQPQL